jgi:hypothetical protein
MRLEFGRDGLDCDPSLRESIRRKLRFVLGRFGTRVVRVAVSLDHQNGHDGGLEKRCRIVVHLTPTGRACVDVTESDLAAAMHGAAERIGPAVSRELMRRRDKRG